MKEEIKKRLEKIKQAEMDIANEKQFLPLVELRDEDVEREEMDYQKMYLELLGTGSIEMKFEGMTSRISLEELKDFHTLTKRFLKEIGEND